MQIHLSDITDSEGKHIQLHLDLDLDKISFQMGDYPILEKTPIELGITNTGNKVLELKGIGSVTVGIPCDRCLEQVAVKIPYEIEQKLDMKKSDAERVQDLDENDYLTGMDLDVNEIFIFISIFFRHFISPQLRSVQEWMQSRQVWKLQWPMPLPQA